MRNAFPAGATDGALFIHMEDMPWSNVVTDEVVLDNMYFDSYSGDKFCTNMVYRWMDSDGVVTLLGENALAMSIKTRFLTKWKHLWDAYVAEYRLDRDWYTHEEYTEDDDLTYGKKRDLTTTHDTTDTELVSSTKTNSDTRTDNLTENRTDTRTDNLNESRDETRTDNLTESRDDTRTDNLAHTENSLNSVFGFNSASESGVPSNSNSASSSDTGTQRNAGTTTNTGTERNAGTTTNTGTVQNVGNTTNTGTQTNSGNESLNESTTFEKDGTITDEEEYSGTDARDRVGERDSYGLKAHSIQELLEAEKTLWMWDYFKGVFDDIDSLLCLKIFEPSLIRRQYELV